MGARFWEEIGKQPTSAVIVDRAVRLWMRDTDLNETFSEAEASVVREIMSKVDQAVEASYPMSWYSRRAPRSTKSGRPQGAKTPRSRWLGSMLTTYGSCYGDPPGYRTTAPRYHATSRIMNIGAFVPSFSW